MKTLLLLLVALPLAAILPAAGAPVTVPAEATPIGIIETEPADFPADLSRLGIIDGWAKIVVGVDEAGQLLDALTIGYSHPRFAEAAMAALGRWQYRPAQVAGRPVATVTQVDFNFHFNSSGARIVTLTMLDYGEQLKLRAHKVENRLCSLDQLDSVPMPTFLVNPASSESEIRRHAGKKAIVWFYIDETGRVRLPTVSYADDDAVARLVLAAVGQWRFEPPTSRHRPVITHASQVFVFKGPTN